MGLIFIGIFWALALVALLGSESLALNIFFASSAFGAFAVVPPEAAGGLTILATPVLALILCWRILASPSGLSFMAAHVFNVRTLGLMSLFWVTAVVVTIFAPRLFAGVDIISVRGLVSRPAELGPTTQNLSQLAYMTTSIVFCFAAARLLTLPGRGTVVLSALCVGGMATIATGLLDLANQTVDLSVVMTPLRSATYSLLVDNEIMGTQRLVGLMPEASAFGSVCVAQAVSLHFLSVLNRASATEPAAGLAIRLRPVIVCALVGLAMLSTSSAAYVGLAIFAFAVCLNWAFVFLREYAPDGDRPASVSRGEVLIQAAIGVAGCVAVALALLASPNLFAPGFEMVDRMVFQKGSSASFAERSEWTQVSWDALWATYGFGVGLGGTRASNGIVAVLSSTGVLGGLLYYGFVVQKLLSPPRSRQLFERDLHRRVGWIFLMGLPIGIMIGTSPDFGTGGALILALLSLPSLTALEAPRPRAVRGRSLDGGFALKPTSTLVTGQETRRHITGRGSASHV